MPIGAGSATRVRWQVRAFYPSLCHHQRVRGGCSRACAHRGEAGWARSSHGEADGKWNARGACAGPARAGVARVSHGSATDRAVRELARRDQGPKPTSPPSPLPAPGLQRRVELHHQRVRAWRLFAGLARTRESRRHMDEQRGPAPRKGERQSTVNTLAMVSTRCRVRAPPGWVRVTTASPQPPRWLQRRDHLLWSGSYGMSSAGVPAAELLFAGARLCKSRETHHER